MAASVGVRELKNSLSRYLRLARDGESVVVLDRGRPIAVLSAVPDGDRAPATVAEHLAGLAARGLLTLGTRRRRRAPKSLPRADLSGAVVEDRGERA